MSPPSMLVFLNNIENFQAFTCMKLRIDNKTAVKSSNSDKETVAIEDYQNFTKGKLSRFRTKISY